MNAAIGWTVWLFVGLQQPAVQDATPITFVGSWAVTQNWAGENIPPSAKAPQPVAVEIQMHTNIVANTNVRIRSMAQTHEIIPALKFNANARIHSVRPHMHLLAQNGTTTLVDADGKRRGLLYQPKWEDAWQNFYSLTESAHVTPGAFIEYVASYDNSPANALNPDPKATVKWGQQFEDEMHCVYVTWTEDDPSNFNDFAPIQIPPNKAFTTGLVSSREK